jgi:metal-responsive CopG/Arc/MetJ family transcriptional regulator
MKTAISMPNALYKRAESTALDMGISRNQLFSAAVEEYLNRHNGDLVAKKLNAVYEKLPVEEVTHVLDSNLDSLRRFTKNDTW